MLSEDLLSLLKSWDVDEEYFANFEREKIRKVTTLKLLTERTLEILFPEAGPRLEFKEHLDKFKDDSSKKDSNFQALDTVSAEVIYIEPLQSQDVIDINQTESGVKANGSNSSESQLDEQSTKRGRDDNDNISQAVHEEGQQLNQISEGSSNGACKKARADKSLLELCNNHVDGKLVLAHYKEHSQLDDANRNLLADVCISNFLVGDLNRVLTSKAEQEICDQIIDLFPSECKEIWLGDISVSRERCAGRGKLVNRYYNLRRKMAKVKLIKPFTPSAKGFRVMPDASDDNDEEFKNQSLWLQNNKRPWTQVLDYWKDTTKGRLSQLINGNLPVHTYMDQYPPFKEPEGFVLFEIDFKVLFPDAEMKLFSEWPLLSSFILSKLSAQDKESIEDSLTPESKKLKTLLALCSLFPVITAVRKKKTQWRPSRQECREGLAQFVKVGGDIQTVLNDRREKYEKYGLNLGPQVVCVGDGADSILQSYVVINKIIYEVDNPIKAIDVAFKAMHALDTPYHSESRREWLFLQIAVYGVTTDHDKKSLDVKTTTLINEFKTYKSS